MTAIDPDKAADLAKNAAPHLTEAQFISGLDIAERMKNHGAEKYQDCEEKAECVDALVKRAGKVHKLRKLFQNPVVTGVTGGIAGAVLTGMLMSGGEQQAREPEKTSDEKTVVLEARPCNYYSAPAIVRQTTTGINHYITPANHLLDKNATILEAEFRHAKRLAEVGPPNRAMTWDCDPSLVNGKAVSIPITSLPDNAVDEVIEGLAKVREDMNSPEIANSSDVIVYHFGVERQGQGQRLTIDRDEKNDYVEQTRIATFTID